MWFSRGVVNDVHWNMDGFFWNSRTTVGIKIFFFFFFVFKLSWQHIWAGLEDRLSKRRLSRD